MSKVDWIERYDVRQNGLEGWAVIHIDSRGFLGVVSDHGNYAFHWSHFGDDFKAFLADIDPSYLHGKLTFGSSHVYDGEATAEAIRREILTERRSGSWVAQRARTEWDHFEFHRDEIQDAEEGFSAWCQDTDIDDAWELRRTRPEPQCEAFCRYTWPRFIAKLKAGDRCKLIPRDLDRYRQEVLRQLLADWNEGGIDADVLLEQAFDRAVALMQGCPLPLDSPAGT